MAINPNIALGIQPVQQQPNMLAQYAQIMGIKAAQQDIQGNEDLRAAYAQGGDLNDPEFRRRVMAANPKLGSQLIKTNAETGKLQNEAVAKRIELSREMLTGINTPEDYLAWHESNHKDPVLGGYLSQRGVTAEQSRAKIIADLSKPGGLEKLKRESALGAGKLQQELMQTERSVQVANIGAGATMRGQDMLNAREIEKRDYDRANPKLQRADGEFGFLLYNDRDPNSAQYLGMRPPVAPPAAVTQPSAVNNMLITPGVAQPSVNALTQSSPNQAGPTVAAANALANQPIIPRPKQPIRQPVAVMKDGKAVLVTPQEAVGMQPASADAEKAARLQAQQVRDLNITIKNLADITQPGGLISQSTGSGIGRAYDVAAGFVGNAPEGAIAAAKLAPIADMVLKMVPRFEGPQSDKDTQSYKEAAGQLANPNLPTKIRQEAGKEILRLMKERKDQFVSTDMAREGFGAAPKTVTRTGTLNGRKVVEYSDGTTAYAD
jgi:hypothetical protein